MGLAGGWAGTTGAREARAFYSAREWRAFAGGALAVEQSSAVPRWDSIFDRDRLAAWPVKNVSKHI